MKAIQGVSYLTAIIMSIYSGNLFTQNISSTLFILSIIAYIICLVLFFRFESISGNTMMIWSGLYFLTLSDYLYSLNKTMMVTIILIGTILLITGTINRIKKVGLKNYFKWSNLK